jgi:anti-sigma regulatory factor (Ser/Thr protein kinase)
VLTRFSLEIPRDPEAPARARRALRERFARELTTAQLGDAILIISELVSNALEHGEGTIRLRLAVDRRGMQGEVIDDGAGFEAEVREQGVEELRGRGLWLVATLATKWGIHDGSSHVWFELEFPGSGNQPVSPELGETERPPTLD